MYLKLQLRNTSTNINNKESHEEKLNEATTNIKKVVQDFNYEEIANIFNNISY